MSRLAGFRLLSTSESLLKIFNVAFVSSFMVTVSATATGIFTSSDTEMIAVAISLAASSSCTLILKK